MLAAGGLFFAGRAFPTIAAESQAIEITMRGNADGSRVWFEPLGVLARPGQTIRWINRDPGNSHTSTAYHPANEGHPARIPPTAAPWHSDYLLPDEMFSLTPTISGVYDYYCIPHEHAGMVGRIVVMGEGDPIPAAVSGSPIAGLEADPFPPVPDIVRDGRILAR